MILITGGSIIIDRRRSHWGRRVALVADGAPLEQLRVVEKRGFFYQHRACAGARV